MSNFSLPLDEYRVEDDYNIPAFPVVSEMFGNFSGMSLRDYFAGQALMGCCADPATGSMTHESVAEASYKYANEMMKRRRIP